MHPIENMMKTTMEEIREMIDVNTIVGDPVYTSEGSTIIPISKVSFGFVAGGGEYGDGGSSRQSDNSDCTDNPFAGGGSAGISLNPMAFLVVNDNNVRLLPVNFNTAIDRLIDLIPQAVNMVKSGSEKNKNANSPGIDDANKMTREASPSQSTLIVGSATTLNSNSNNTDGSKAGN